MYVLIKPRKRSAKQRDEIAQARAYYTELKRKSAIKALKKAKKKAKKKAIKKTTPKGGKRSPWKYYTPKELEKNRKKEIREYKKMVKQLPQTDKARIKFEKDIAKNMDDRYQLFVDE